VPNSIAKTAYMSVQCNTAQFW